MSNFSQVSGRARILDCFIQLHINYRISIIFLLNYLLSYKHLLFPIQLINISYRCTHFGMLGFGLVLFGFFYLAAFNSEVFVFLFCWGL